MRTDDELGRAAADVDHDRGLGGGAVAVVHRTEERQLSLFIAGEHPRVEAGTRSHKVSEGGAGAASRTAEVSTARFSFARMGSIVAR